MSLLAWLDAGSEQTGAKLSHCHGVHSCPPGREVMRLPRATCPLSAQCWELMLLCVFSDWRVTNVHPRDVNCCFGNNKNK